MGEGIIPPPVYRDALVSVSHILYVNGFPGPHLNYKRVLDVNYMISSSRPDQALAGPEAHQGRGAPRQCIKCLTD